jgi:Rieske Fe-S protein
MDALAFIGRNPWDGPNVYIATGDSGNGLTHGTIAGMLISDLVTKTPNALEAVYDPRRFKLAAAAPVFFKENLGVLLEYLKDTPGNAEARYFNDIQAGEGKIIEIKGEKFGIYRDDSSELHIVSAVCTHLKCIVRWNADELTWDCPCHGSRFTPTGKVINGPSNSDLPYYRKREDAATMESEAVLASSNGQAKKEEESWSL